MPPTPAEVLAALLRSDPGRPRVTFYEDTPGPTSGERIELSAKVLGNWVSKAANALQEEWDLAPGSRVRLALPPHWRSLYWALAVWSVGATVVLDDGEADLVVTDDPALATTSPAVLVTLAALARGATEPVPAGAMDDAKELATYADQFSAWDEPAPSDPAVTGAGDAAYEDVVPQRDWGVGVRVHTAAGDLGAVLGTALAAWSLDGSLVLSRGPEPAGGRGSRLSAEGVTQEA
ncbi:TIGR03089 family protein [Pedococcus dokdonensis]|uniref:TIGR03089 family protein n=1 Tax=Pedococcus dokdonensis TaxID=443156 RepID=A0A1H0RH25_9MICO|nr:TIGR03089 family protein [Pedococcus dokdonensis]SDP28316.1 TIGR03089 family protein [Pedococcus dokdonensis]